MPRKNTHALALERVPNIARPVVVPAKQHSAGDGEGDGSDSAEDVVVCEGVELAVGSEVKEAAGGVVGAGGKGVAVGEEPDMQMREDEVARGEGERRTGPR